MEIPISKPEFTYELRIFNKEGKEIEICWGKFYRKDVHIISCLSKKEELELAKKLVKGIAPRKNGNEYYFTRLYGKTSHSNEHKNMFEKLVFNNLLDEFEVK